MSETPSTTLERDLIVQMGWLRRLATDLVGTAQADDLVQQTYVAALSRPPATDRSIRPWLAKVMRNAANMHRRAGVRRERREAVAGVPLAATPDVESLLRRAQSLRIVGEALEALDDPYRATILLRYLEEVPSAEIAQREGIAVGTVRWRLKTGLEMLRIELDRRHGGSRTEWCSGLVAIVMPNDSSGVAAAAGAITMKLSTKLVIAAAIVTLVSLGAAVGVSSLEPSDDAAAEDATPTIQAGVEAESAPKSPRAVASASPGVRRFATQRERRAMLARVRAARSASRGSDPASDAAAVVDDERFTEAVDEALGAPQVTAEFLLPALHECIDILPADAKGSLTLRMEVSGAPDVGALITDSQLVADLSTEIEPDVVECAVETTYSLELPPPPVAGSARIDLSIGFDRASGGFLARVGTATPATPEERIYSGIDEDGQPVLYRKSPAEEG